MGNLVGTGIKLKLQLASVLFANGNVKKSLEHYEAAKDLISSAGIHSLKLDMLVEAHAVALGLDVEKDKLMFANEINNKKAESVSDHKVLVKYYKNIKDTAKELKILNSFLNSEEICEVSDREWAYEEKWEITYWAGRAIEEGQDILENALLQKGLSDRWKCWAHCKLGQFYYQDGQFIRSFENYEKGLDYSVQNRVKGLCYIHMAEIIFRLNNNDINKAVDLMELGFKCFHDEDLSK